MEYCHNPYFSRWFSAIAKKYMASMPFVDGHNPYFSRWFSAICLNYLCYSECYICHNPYFSRWFSAIKIIWNKPYLNKNVTILILVDGFLQYFPNSCYIELLVQSQSLF